MVQCTDMSVQTCVMVDMCAIAANTKQRMVMNQHKHVKIVCCPCIHLMMQMNHCLSSACITCPHLYPLQHGPLIFTDNSPSTAISKCQVLCCKELPMHACIMHFIKYYSRSDAVLLCKGSSGPILHPTGYDSCIAPLRVSGRSHAVPPSGCYAFETALRPQGLLQAC